MRLALVLTALPAVTGAAGSLTCHLDQEVAQAVHVVQIANHDVFESSSGICWVAGPAVEVFRGDLARGEVVRAYFNCGEPLAGDLSLDVAAIARARVVELHISDEWIAGDGRGLKLLEAPTEAPALELEHLEGC